MLCDEGYESFAVVDFKDIRGQVGEIAPDLILLDMGLPGRDGLTLCAQLRRDMDIPIIFVTGHDSVGDELSALRLGGEMTISQSPTISPFCWRISRRCCAGAAGLGRSPIS